MIILGTMFVAVASYSWGFFVGYKSARKWHWEAGFVAGHEAASLAELDPRPFVMEIKE